MSRNRYVRRNRMGGLDPLSRYAPMYAPEQVSDDPRSWKPLNSIKARQAEALVLLGRAEPIQLQGLPWILGYRYINSASTTPRSSCALTEYTAYAAAASDDRSLLTPSEKRELDRLEAWRPK